MSRLVTVFFFFLLAAAPARSSAKTVDVDIVGFAFSPASVTIAVNDSIRWTNKDSTAHTATSTSSAFDSKTLNQNQTYIFTFTKAGSYPYTCTFHPSMSGTIVVQESPPPPPLTFAISGTISGPGAAGASVAVSGPKSVTVIADAGGAYVATELPVGSYTVRPSLSGYFYTPASRIVPITTADVVGVDFLSSPLPPVTFSLSGRVTGPVGAGVAIEVIGPVSRTTTTNALGDWQVGGLTDGEYEITPSLAGYEFTPGKRTVTIAGRSIGGQNFSNSPIPVDELDVAMLEVKTKAGKTGKDSIALTATLTPLPAHPFDASAAVTLVFGDYVLQIPAGSIVPRGNSGRKLRYKAGKTKVSFTLDSNAGTVAIQLSAKKMTVGDLVDTAQPIEIHVMTGEIEAMAVK